MKPITTNSLSVWGYIGYFLLFNTPYVGTVALIICAIFARNPSLKNFARALIIIELITLIIAAVILIIPFALGEFTLEEFLEEFYFDLNYSEDEGTALITNARYLIGI